MELNPPVILTELWFIPVNFHRRYCMWRGDIQRTSSIPQNILVWLKNVSSISQIIKIWLQNLSSIFQNILIRLKNVSSISQNIIIWLKKRTNGQTMLEIRREMNAYEM
jgi:hypothetical protein